MQSGSGLKARLKALFDTIENEASRNPAFADQLATVFSEVVPGSGRNIRSGSSKSLPVEVPDVFAALQEKGDEEFTFWLGALDVSTLKAIVKKNGFDPAKTSQRWKYADKFVALIHDQTGARLRRGSAFLPPKANSPLPD